MDLWQDNKYVFGEIQDYLQKFEEFGYVYMGYGDEIVKEELSNIIKSFQKIGKVLDDNYSI